MSELMGTVIPAQTNKDCSSTYEGNLLGKICTGIVLLGILYKTLSPMIPYSLKVKQDVNTNLYGYVNGFGVWYIKPQYKNAYGFYNGAAYVEVDSADSFYCINIYNDRIPDNTCLGVRN